MCTYTTLLVDEPPNTGTVPVLSMVIAELLTGPLGFWLELVLPPLLPPQALNIIPLATKVATNGETVLNLFIINCFDSL